MPRIGRYENPYLTVEFHRDLPAAATSDVVGLRSDDRAKGDHYGFAPAGGGGRDAAIGAIVAWLREKGF
jgi:hypothetical protein